MKNFFLFLLIVFGFFFSKIVEASNQSKQEKINTFIKKCKKYHRSSDSLIFYGEKLISYSDTLAIQEGYFALSYAHQLKLKIDSAIYYLKSGLNYIDQNKHYQFFSRYFRMLSICEIKAANYEKSIAYANKLIEVAAEKKDSITLAISYNSRAQANKMKGKLEEAVSDAKKSLLIKERMRAPQQVNSLFTIALVYVKMEQDSIALRWFKEAYRRSLKFKSPILVYRALNNLGTHFRELGKLDSSTYYYNLLLSHKEKLSHRQILLLYQNLADNATQLKHFNKADSLIALCYTYLNSGEDLQRRSELLHIHAELEEGKQNYPKAIQLVDSCIAISNQSGAYMREMDMIYHKAKLLEANGDNKGALASLKLYQQLKDSLSAKQDIEKIQEVISEYELEKKEKQLAKAIIGNSSLKQLFLILGAFFVVLFGVSFWLWRRNKSLKLNSTHRLLINDLYFPNIATKDSKAEKISQKGQQIILKSKAVIAIEQLRRIESEGHYLSFYLKDKVKPEIDRNSLKDFMVKLDSYGFFRSHRSHLINPNYVKAVYSNRILMKSGEEIPLSRTFKQKLKNQGHPLFSK